MDLTEIRKLVRLMLRADLSELEIDDSKKGCRVHLKRSVGTSGGGGGPAPVVQFMPPPGAPVPQGLMGSGSMALDPGVDAPLPPGTEAFPSPMVGTFYRAPSPDSDPFVDVGDSFTEDKVLCIIEAMKVMNEIKAEGKGQIVEILVESGEPIEFGQPLFDQEGLMFRRVLIANRGEIAQRIIRACRELGIETVAIYSEADADALHLRQADETICVGPAAGAQSYLNIPAIISAAEIADVEAIVPGYGFLAENAHFAEVCKSCNIQFVGPDPETIDAVGNKSNAREMAVRAGVPVVPGSDGPVEDEETALKVAAEIGYPVMIKASAGGGGRGMRVASNHMSLINAFHAARAEAGAAFNDDTVYLEKFIENPRHVEVQILGDRDGNLVWLGERDCSVQRRHQKLVEEAPSPILTEEKRAAMGTAAIAIAKEAKYHNAGTVEFLLDKHGDFYFIEVNARIQVEHTVTEMVTGVDLIQWQLKLASGEPLDFTQDDVKIRGHAIECRINAEDPDRDFQPSPGKIDLFVPPGGPGVRVDSHCYSGYRIPPYYDSMIGKLLTHRNDRRTAIATMLRALDEFVIEGVKTTIPIHRRILSHSDFVSGEHDTGFVERYFGNTTRGGKA